ncbi:Afadin and alpha-actinin-binding-domain-containing protein [Cyathus striatus]|nr:Afadin and alpha-actinin-binding-domain-containing protein [Cyathus striatus]
MAKTPQRVVHWDLQSPSFSDFADSASTSIDGEFSSSTAHGFTSGSGLNLDGVSVKESEKVVKCLLAMLGQRVEDMNRTEELTGKYRTLSYDFERLTNMHRNANEKAASAEKETNLHKSRLSALQKTLQNTESAHKHTSSELQRARITLQGVRSAHQAELKKRDKEVERITEKWSKLAEAQSKLSVASAGLRCANVAIVDGSELLGKTQGFLDIALDEAEKARGMLADENTYLRKLVLKAINNIQEVIAQVTQHEEKPIPYTITTLFPLTPADNPSSKLNTVLTALRDRLASLSETPAASTSSTSSKAAQPRAAVSDSELERLQGIIASLKEELALSQKQNMLQAAETQAMFDKFAEDHKKVQDDVAEMSMELMSAPLQDEEKKRLDKIKLELQQERDRFTEATIKLGKEKAALEADRLRLLEEKRAWQVEQMLADLPPTPNPNSPIRIPQVVKLSPKKSPRKSPKKPLHKSPAKPIAVGKATSPSKIIPSYETEVLPPIPALSFSSLKPLSSVLPSTFVLPPPSPRASLPSKPVLSSKSSPPLDIPKIDFQYAEESPTDLSPPEMPSPPDSLSPDPSPPIPSTPSKRAFPVAKPFAQRMIHAYSPAKPSPLSRILMLADSPNSPPRAITLSSGSLGVVTEEEDNDGGLGCGNKPLFPPASQPQMSLAAELGVESPPLQEKKVEPNVVKARPVPIGKSKVFHPPQAGKKPPTSKGKVKTDAPSMSRSRTLGLGEKENEARKKSGKNSSSVTMSKVTPPSGIATSGKSTKTDVKPVGTSTHRVKVSTKPPVPKGGGPRRVPIDSAEAPPLVKRR